MRKTHFGSQGMILNGGGGLGAGQKKWTQKNVFQRWSEMARKFVESLFDTMTPLPFSWKGEGGEGQK